MPVEVSASSTEWEGKLAVYSVFRDIRDRQEARDADRRNEKRLRSLIQNLSDIIIVLTVDGRMIFHTPSAEKVLGYESRELDGQNFFDFLHEQDAPCAGHAGNSRRTTTSARASFVAGTEMLPGSGWKRSSATS